MSLSEQKPKSIKKTLIAVILGLILLFSAIAFTGWYSLLRRTPITTYETAADHFKYASIGTEAVNAIPYWIWVVLPRLFPENLPGSGGYTSLGLTWEEGQEMPIGLTKESIGINRVGVNCALCHVGTVRETPLSKPSFLLGAPSTKFDVQRYAQFFFNCANDPRFTAGFILPEIEYNHHLSWLENAFYRYIVIPQTKQELLKQEQAFQWMKRRPATGSGRADINQLKIKLLNLSDDGSVGSSDIPAIWNQKQHQGFSYYSDGINPSLREVILSNALATGTTPQEINLDNLARIEQWLQELAPPSYPFTIDRDLAQQGKEVFNQNCASCHAFGSARVGQVIPMQEIGTDPNRWQSWTLEASEGMNLYAEKYPWDFDNFGKTDGYVAPALDGIWARAPYLHNGSVPSLKDLLTKPSDRPKQFYRGYDVYDQDKVGFISTSEAATRSSFLLDTTVTGNGNYGHIFGTNLEENEKDALVEYLKTL